MELSAFGLSEGWARHELAGNPAILGVSENYRPIQERVQQGRLDLLFECQIDRRMVLVELQRNNVDASHVTRLLEYLSFESGRRADWQCRAALIAESFEGAGGRLAEAVARIGTIELWKMSAIVTEDGPRLTLERHEPATFSAKISRPDEHTEKWKMRPWYPAAQRLIKKVETCDPACGPKFNQSFIGVQRNGGTYNCLAIHDRGRDRFDLELKLDKSDAAEHALRQAGLNHTYQPGGVDRRHYRVTIPSSATEEMLSSLSSLVGQAHRRWEQRRTKQA